MEKFGDFKQFCQAKVNLSIWQVLNAIKSAQVCVKLVNLEYTELPRNASQALKMSELSIERLDEVWGKVLKSCEGHKITAHAIESQIHPDKEPTTSTIRVPALLGGRIAREAIEYGLTVTEYLEMLVAGKHPAEAPIEETSHPIDPELKQAVDDLDLKFKQQPAPIAPVKALNQCLDNFNALMESMLGGRTRPVNRGYS